MSLRNKTLPRMKTIFLTCYHGFISRNILNSNALKILRGRDFKIVVFAPPNKKDFLEEYYAGPNVIIEALDLEPVIRTVKNKFWYRLAFLLQNTHYIIDQRRERLFRHPNILGYLNYFLVNATAAILSRFRIFHSAYRFLDFLFSPKNYFAKFIDEYRPDLFFSTDIFSECDALFLREARQKKIKIIGMVRSWDNTTTKGVLRVIPEKILVNGPITKKELIKMHDVAGEDIEIVGIPQFDSWPSGPSLSREEFFRQMQIDVGKKLILFSPAGSILSDTDWQICQVLKDAIKGGSLPKDIQFLIRSHPAHPADFSKFKSNDHFIFEMPGTHLGMPGTRFESGYKGIELSPDDNSHLKNSIFYSDIVMIIATSLGLDATVFDKPQIIISFDGWVKKPYVNSVKRYHNEDNLRSFILSGGVRVVENKEDLFRWINKYLKEPRTDEAGRKKAVEDHMFKIDRGAGERIADFIINAAQ